MGHDIIPHKDSSDEVAHEHNPGEHQSLPVQFSFSFGEVLGHLFSHVQHENSAKTLVYLNFIEKKAGAHINAFYHIGGLSEFSDNEFWYANYKKQRFWYNESPALYSLRHSLILRGPPAC
ncbi:hypothetical protein [Arcticibacter tournemirensis]|nr:hypothetical protein [Arcticibacter tournemirensis]